MIQSFYDFIGIQSPTEPIQAIIITICGLLIVSISYGVIQMVFDIITSIFGRKRKR